MWFKSKLILSQYNFYPTKMENWMGNGYAIGCNKRTFGLRACLESRKVGVSSKIQILDQHWGFFLTKLVFLNLSFCYLSFYRSCKRCILLKIMNHSISDLRTDFGVWNRCDWYSSEMEILFQSFPSNMDYISSKKMPHAFVFFEKTSQKQNK